MGHVKNFEEAQNWPISLTVETPAKHISPRKQQQQQEAK